MVRYVHFAQGWQAARLSLGTYPATPLARARTLAIEARGHVEFGVDPRDLGKPATAGPMTVAMLAESYLAKHASTLRSYKEVARKLHSDILPIIGDMPLATSIAVTCIACSIQSRNAAPPHPLARCSPNFAPC